MMSVFVLLVFMIISYIIWDVFIKMEGEKEMLIEYEKTFVKDGRIDLVENYKKALYDNFDGWILSHRLVSYKYKNRKRDEWVKREQPISPYQLTMLNLYFNRDPKELIWIKR